MNQITDYNRLEHIKGMEETRDQHNIPLGKPLWKKQLRRSQIKFGLETGCYDANWIRLA